MALETSRATETQTAEPQTSEASQVEMLLRRMTQEEKIALLSGGTFFDSRGIDRLGIRPLTMTDGPHGVRNGRATCFPVGVAMASTWNPCLLERIGAALAEESLAKGRNVLLGPCVNIHRTPLGGRNFESFGEDPHLAARMAVAYIRGVQSQGVAASVKHYACNNQETGRFTTSVEVDERTLHEIYLPAFKTAVCEGRVWTVMSAHNKVNGSYCSEHEDLLVRLLKAEWGFDGLVVSDWGGVRSTEGAARNGMDLEMPGPGDLFAAPLADAVADGRVSEAAIDDKVRRILRVMHRVGALTPNREPSKGALDTPTHRSLARQAARESIVLLKNRGDLLPLSNRIRSIAVLGPNAKEARVGGGGSSLVTPFYAVSPIEGLKARCSESIEIRHAVGCLLPSDLLPIDASCLSVDREGSAPGVVAEYFSNDQLEGDPVLTRNDPRVDFDWGDGSPDPSVPPDHFSARWTGFLTPPISGRHGIGLRSDDGSRLFLDGRLIVDNWGAHGPKTETATLELEAGRKYVLRVEYQEVQGKAMVRLGWIPPLDLMKEAQDLAAGADVAVVCVGLSEDFEGEDIDRAGFELPGEQAKLIETVAAANSNTIVVLVNGSPVSMQPWLDRVPVVIEAWYPGQEGGHALAEILFGEVNPSGRLPVTLPRRLEDSPSHGNYPGDASRVRYAEGLFVGYRGFEAASVKPEFPFGHGLSYTSYRYSNLLVTLEGEGADTEVAVGFDVENSGSREGQEVAQIYLRDVRCNVLRPDKELKGFTKVSLRPGERKHVAVKLTRSDLSFYNAESHEWVLEPGEFEVLVGSSSQDVRLRGKISWPSDM